MHSLVIYYFMLLQYYSKTPDLWSSVKGLKATGLTNLLEVTGLAICEARVQVHQSLFPEPTLLTSTPVLSNKNIQKTHTCSLKFSSRHI